MARLIMAAIIGSGIGAVIGTFAGEQLERTMASRRLRKLLEKMEERDE